MPLKWRSKLRFDCGLPLATTSMVAKRPKVVPTVMVTTKRLSSHSNTILCLLLKNTI